MISKRWILFKTGAEPGEAPGVIRTLRQAQGALYCRALSSSKRPGLYAHFDKLRVLGVRQYINITSNKKCNFEFSTNYGMVTFKD